MTAPLCLYCRRYPATRLAVPYSGERYFCCGACAVRWAVRELDREPAGETVTAGDRREGHRR